MLRVTADRTRCIGAGLCVFHVDGVFDQDEQDGRVLLLTERPGPELADAVRYATKLCPARALSVHEN